MFINTISYRHCILSIVIVGTFCGTLYYTISIMPQSEQFKEKEPLQAEEVKEEEEEEEQDATTKAMPGYLGGAYNGYVFILYTLTFSKLLTKAIIIIIILCEAFAMC